MPTQAALLSEGTGRQHLAVNLRRGARPGPRGPKTEAYQTSPRQRKKVEMLFAHLKRILKLDRLRLRGPNVCARPLVLGHRVFDTACPGLGTRTLTR